MDIDEKIQHTKKSLSQHHLFIKVSGAFVPQLDESVGLLQENIVPVAMITIDP